MKRHLVRVLTLICSFVFLSIPITLQSVVWNNLSGPNPGVLDDVVDEDLQIIGVNALVGGIHIVADTVDIDVDVNMGDAVVTSTGNREDGMPIGAGDEGRLYIFANTGRTVNFNLEDSLTFRGASDLGTIIDLLVTVSGPGEVIFNIDGGQQVCLTALPSQGGALLFVAMDDPNSPTLIFQRSTQDAQNIEIKIGRRSRLGFIAETPAASIATEEGSIVFNPFNESTGCTIVRIEDCGAFVIYGSWLDADIDSDFVLADIDFGVLAGELATVEIQNTAVDDGTPAPLQIINENTKFPNFMSDPFCDNAFENNPQQYGFILGPNAKLLLNDLTYLDYIGTVTNGVPVVTTPLENVQQLIADLIECHKIPDVQSLIKERNASAFFVDGTDDENATDACITMEGDSAIYFRSGVDCNGDVTPTFTIDPDQETMGAGNIVFDVEGELDVFGDPDGDNALNVLSLQVTKTGCPVLPESDETQFPQRTFARDADGRYLQYNKAAWLINNRMNIFDASLLHTDEIHNVYDRADLGRNDLASEPTYIGGETFKICLPIGQPRPTIAFYNSIFRMCTDAASTGVDFRIPNLDEEEGNVSTLRFYNNGRRIDNGYGRFLVLGTTEGSLSGCGFPIDKDSHLDTFQETTQETATPQMLCLDIGENTNCITENVPADIEGQCAVQTIFLNNASNISIGTNGAQGIDIDTGLPFDPITTPSVLIKGDFYSFETAGGLWGYPESGATTGQGAIFVDTNGTFGIDAESRANIATMVVKSRNGVINLPKRQVYFANRIGIAHWNVDLTDPAQQVLIPAGTCLSDFTMDWGDVTKDYVTSNSFVPYEPKGTPLPCMCPPVTDANLRSLPMVLGQVDQFQIKRSRIGDQAHLQVKGGIIRELVFLLGCNSAEAPVGFLVVEDEALVGIGTAHRNLDSLSASVKLGIDGLIICANGDADIELNENILVDNVCAIVTGTSFGVDSPSVLTIHAQLPTEFRIKSTGILDLSQFDNDNKILQFAGAVQLVCEPGARIVLGGGTLVFTDEAAWTFERVLDTDLLIGTQPRDLDPIRVKLSGQGIIVFEEDAHMDLFEDQFFGIETDPECSLNTTFTILLNNQAKINIGTASQPGGSFQIGNTSCQTDATVDVTFIIDGVGTLFQINRQGFFGMGVGMANKVSSIPNEWLVNCLENVVQVTFDIREGNFSHNQIVSGNENTAALLAIGPADSYTFNFDVADSRVLGGGNMVLLTDCLDDMCDDLLRADADFSNMPRDAQTMLAQAQRMMEEATAMMQEAKGLILQKTRGPKPVERIKDLLVTSRSIKDSARKMVRNVIIPSLNPTVTDTAGTVSANLQAGILAGKLLLVDAAKPAQPVGVTPQAFFNYLFTTAFTTQSAPRANMFRDQVALSFVGFVDGTTIRREAVQFILGTNGYNMADHDHSLRLGAVNINLNDVGGDINNLIEIRGEFGNQ